MSSTLEQRLKHLFPDKGSCLKDIACVFAERRGQWLAQEDIINLLKDKYANSTICSNFKRLSSPMKELNDHSYIETDILKNVRGRPTIRGKLSEAAFERIFKLVSPVTERPPPYKVGRIIIPPMPIGDPEDPIAWISPEDMMALREQKLGEDEAIHTLQDVVDNGDPFAKPFYDFKHYCRPGPRPCKHYITNAGCIEWGSDENRACCSLSAYIVDTRQDDARVHAIEERAKTGEREAFDELIQVLLNDPSKYARQNAVHSLGRLGDPRAIRSLIKAMLNDEYSGVRFVAVEKLEPFGYRQELAMALKDSDPYVRREVATVLGKIGNTSAVGPLKESLKDSDIGVKCATANALGEIGDIEAIDSLIPMLDCENESVRYAAAIALGNIGDLRAIQALRKACDYPSAGGCYVAKKALEKLEKKIREKPS